MDFQSILENKGLLDELIKRIADEVIHRLNNRPKKALVIFTGAAIGFKQELEAIQKLKDDGWELKVFLSDAAMGIFSPDMIAERLGVEQICHSKVKYNQRDLYQDVDKIIVAATTVNTAAKVACGICDTDALTLINHGIMAGTEMICCVNGACPDDAERAKLGMGKSPEGYRELLRNNFRAMIRYGFTLCTAKDLYATCIGEKTVPSKKAQEEAKAEDKAATPVASVKKATAASALRLDKHVISSQDLRANQQHKVIHVPQDALITQSALDFAKDFGITLSRV